jgi:hypothetical protein
VPLNGHPIIVSSKDEKSEFLSPRNIEPVKKMELDNAANMIHDSQLQKEV